MCGILSLKPSKVSLAASSAKCGGMVTSGVTPLGQTSSWTPRSTGLGGYLCVARVRQGEGQ